MKKELENNPQKPLIGINNYEDLQKNNSTLIIDKKLTEEEIDNLKYICPNKQIYIRINDYDNLEKILNKILELDYNPEIKIDIKEVEKFNQTNIYKEEKYEKLNILIINNSNYAKFQDYKKLEQILYLFLKPIEERGYSPFEKYIYAYNITKKFKEYQEVPENQKKTESRNLYDILVNEYMVCVGYGNLFRNLLNKLEIKNMELHVEVAVDAPKEEREFIGHDRTYVHIQDPKYGIDGYYIADPTYDSHIFYDYYNYLIVTAEEMNKNKEKIKSTIKSHPDINALFCFKDLKEFYQIINYLINKELNAIFSIKKKHEKTNTKQTIAEIYLMYILKILKNIKILDYSKYVEIKTKYNIQDRNSFKKALDLDVYPKIIEELGIYLLTKVNNPVSGKTIIDAAMVINQDVLNLNEEENMEYRKYLIERNRERQAEEFPYIIIENVTTERRIHQNVENKFEIYEMPEYQQESGKVR